MSSDRLSFNQSADGEDDGSRWEAYEALMRRKAAASPPAGADDGLPEAEEGFAAPGVRAPAAEPAAEDHDERFVLAPRQSASGLAAPDDAEAGGAFPDELQLSRPLAPAPRAWPRFVVAAVVVLVAGGALGAALLPHDWSQPAATVQRLVASIRAPAADPRPAAPRPAPPIPPAAVVRKPAVSIPPAEPPAPAAQNAPRAETAVIAAPEARGSKPALSPAPPPVRSAAKSSGADPQSAKLALEKRDGRQSPALRTRREQPQCWAADAAGAPRLVDCPEFAAPSEPARPGDGYLHLPNRPQN